MKKGKGWVWFYFLTIAAVLLAAQWGSRAVTVIAENTPVEREHRIVIDAGHGGEDGGATSCTGIVESTYNLSISTRLNDLFHLLGYETRMIRTTDTSVYTKGETIAQKKVSDLKERVRMVNETEKALLLSIHQNSLPSSPVTHGAQVFWNQQEGAEELAEVIQTALNSTVNVGNEKHTKRIPSTVYLMKHVTVPAVLVECGFLTNREETTLLQDETYQRGLAVSITAGYLRGISEGEAP